MPTRLLLHTAVEGLPTSHRSLALQRGCILHLRMINAKKAIATWYSPLGDGELLSYAKDSFYRNEKEDEEIYEVWDNPLTVLLPDGLLRHLPFPYVGDGTYLRRVRHRLEHTPILRRYLKEYHRCEIYRS